MDMQSKWGQSTDAQRCSSKLWQLEEEVLSVVPGKEPGGTVLTAPGVRVCATCVTAHRKTNAACSVHFLSFIIKGKIVFGLISVRKTRYSCGSLTKAK